jgi:hypothetical protein
MGSPESPLLLIMMTDQSPVDKELFMIGQLDSISVSSGVKLVSEHSIWSPAGSTRMLYAVSGWQPEKKGKRDAKKMQIVHTLELRNKREIVARIRVLEVRLAILKVHAIGDAVGHGRSGA